MSAQAAKVNTAENFIEEASPNKANFKDQLKSTIDVFSDLSSKLTDSYQQLEQRVTELQGELQETDRLREKELTEKEQLAVRLERVLNVMPAAVITLDGNGVVIHANCAARKMLGEPLEGQRWIDIINRSFLPDPTDGHEIALKNGKLVSLATESLGDEPGQIIVLNDLTETRKLQKQVSHHQKLSEMGKMTASLAHQIRTPLSTALIYADHLSQPKVGSVRKIRFAQKLKEQLLHLQSQVNDMLIFSKGGIVIDEFEHVGKLVCELTERFDEISMRKGVNVVTDIVTLGMSIQCNRDLLISAFTNLIENSMQAMLEAGTEFPTVVVRAQEHPQGVVNIQVIDNGPGIPEDIINRVREPFFTTKSTGTGLGMAVVQAIAIAHGAELELTNLPEGGLQVDFSLPLKRPTRTNRTSNPKPPLPAQNEAVTEPARL
ncbi:MAG: ATP-binding protein [Pseudomonadales bacterium]|nr:ATP-binding protein [Pseudomonadales bacterium]